MGGEFEEVLMNGGSAGAWSTWENSTSKLIVDAEYIKRSEDPKWFVGPRFS